MGSFPDEIGSFPVEIVVLPDLIQITIDAFVFTENTAKTKRNNLGFISFIVMQLFDPKSNNLLHYLTSKVFYPTNLNNLSHIK